MYSLHLLWGRSYFSTLLWGYTLLWSVSFSSSSSGLSFLFGFCFFLLGVSWDLYSVLLQLWFLVVLDSLRLTCICYQFASITLPSLSEFLIIFFNLLGLFLRGRSWEAGFWDFSTQQSVLLAEMHNGVLCFVLLVHFLAKLNFSFEFQPLKLNICI